METIKKHDSEKSKNRFFSHFFETTKFHLSRISGLNITITLHGILCAQKQPINKWNTGKFALQIFGAPKIPKGFFSVLSIKNH